MDCDSGLGTSEGKSRVMEVSPAAAHPPLSPAGWRERAKASVPGPYSLPRPGRTLRTGARDPGERR